jgi:hypothetical protein
MAERGTSTTRSGFRARSMRVGAEARTRSASLERGFTMSLTSARSSDHPPATPPASLPRWQVQGPDRMGLGHESVDAMRACPLPPLRGPSEKRPETTRNDTGPETTRVYAATAVQRPRESTRIDPNRLAPALRFRRPTARPDRAHISRSWPSRPPVPAPWHHSCLVTSDAVLDEDRRKGAPARGREQRRRRRSSRAVTGPHARLSSTPGRGTPCA